LHTGGKLLAGATTTDHMMPRLKSMGRLKVVLGVLALAFAWMCFQIGTHHHTGILRTLAATRQFFGNTSKSSGAQQRHIPVPGERQHNVSLSWKPSTSAVSGYNVYRTWGSETVKLNSAPVTGTTYVDSTAQSGETYTYVTKALSEKGIESIPSNQVQVTIPSP
jgi:hypothetical protein